MKYIIYILFLAACGISPEYNTLPTAYIVPTQDVAATPITTGAHDYEGDTPTSKRLAPNQTIVVHSKYFNRAYVVHIVENPPGVITVQTDTPGVNIVNNGTEMVSLFNHDNAIEPIVFIRYTPNEHWLVAQTYNSAGVDDVIEVRNNDD